MKNTIACSSFAVLGEKNIYGMNFDYKKFPVKFIILKNKNLKTFHLAFQRPLNGKKIWAATAGMNSKGLFASCQEEDPPQKSFRINPDESSINTHQLYMKINEFNTAIEIEELCGKKRLVQHPQISIHNLFADKI